MEFRILRPEEREAWAAFCAQNFDEPAAYFLRHYHNDPWADPDAIFTAWEEGVICGSVRVLTREIYLKGEKIRCGGIGEVCTAKEARGKGVSTSLLHMAIAYMEQKQLPLSMLFTGTQHHYAHLGWFTAPRRYVHWDVSGAEAEGMLDECPSTATLSALHDRLAARVDGVIVRNSLYWERWVAGENWHTAVWMTDGKAAAYAVYRAAEGAPLTVSECLGDSHEQAAALLCALCRKYAAPTRVFMAASCAPTANDFTESYGTMVRLNAPFTLGGTRIETTAALAAAMADSTFFSVDSY